MMMATYKLTIERELSSGKIDTSYRMQEADTEESARNYKKSWSDLSKVVACELVVTEVAAPAEKIETLNHADAENFLFEMDANNCDELVLKEGFGDEMTVKRADILKFLGLNEAKRIKDTFKTSAASFAECEKLGTAEQDFENETTTYTFEDGSKLQHNNSEIEALCG